MTTTRTPDLTAAEIDALTSISSMGRALLAERPTRLEALGLIRWDGGAWTITPAGDDALAALEAE